MKTVIITSSAILMTVGLVSCNTWNTAGSTVNNGVRGGANVVYHTGNAVVKGTGAVVGTGAAIVHGTGTAVTNTVGGVVGTGVGVLTGQSANYRQNQVIYHNGHRYILKNGRYVRLNP